MVDAAPVRSDAELIAFNDAWDEFFGAVRRARGRAQRHADESGELSPSQYHLLIALAEEPELPVGEIALRAGVSSPTATRALDALARRGLVEREHSVADRRMVTVRLTPTGMDAVARKRSFLLARRAELYSGLDRTERAQAERLLGRLAELIEAW